MLLFLALLSLGCGQSGKDSPAETGSTETGNTETGTDDTDEPFDPECGNGVVETGEACDDAGESASCDTDCTQAECGDGVTNGAAGEDCDDPASDDLCLDDCAKRVGNCHMETPWGEIALSLTEHDVGGMLPLLPEANIDPGWGSPTPEFLTHTIAPDERFPDDDVSSEDCEPPIFWDSERIQLGSFVTPGDEDEDPYCRIRASSLRETDQTLYFANRARDANVVPITGEPTRVRLRFPIPEGHKATKLTYSVNWARLFGSHPEECQDFNSVYDDTDDLGQCFLNALDENESWDEDLPPGLHLLWGRSTDCEGWWITGPHEPAASLSWSGLQTFTVEVPESLNAVDELVVSVLVYHQYPGGCDGTTCYSGRYVHANLGFGGASLTTEAAFGPSLEPDLSHPRLFGDNETWLAANGVFDTLPCYGPEWSTGSTLGGLPNIRNNWDVYTKGGAVCLGEVPEAVGDLDDAAAYLDGTAAERFDVSRAVRMLHMIRHERACRVVAGATCYHDEAEIDELAGAVIGVEMDRIRDVAWNTHGFDFDLKTREPMRVYTLLADVLWDELSAAQHAEILAVTGEQVDGYLEHFYEPHWSIYNGNNWTPVLTEAALHWAIVYYHEDDRAPELAWRSLQSLWLHRDFYLGDGVYKEGLSYSQVSFDPLMASARLAGAAFGLQLESIPWEKMEGFSSWTLAVLGSDMHAIDFRDSWAKNGWGNFWPLVAHMVDTELGTVTAAPDPCFAHRFFSNKYYYHGLADPWNVHPALAKDWPTIVDDCDATDGMIPNGIVLQTWEEGGWGTARVGRPGATDIAASEGSDAPSRYKQADQVMLAVSAIPNATPHTEMDFGTFIWIAYGNRLIWDFGYGDLTGDRYLTSPDHNPDQNPTGHSTLVIPEAYRDGDTSTNTSQIDGRSGTIETASVDGHEIILLDGSRVYGRDDPELGWLEHFHRRVLPLESGHMILIDDFMVRADRGTAEVAEYWYTQPWEEVPDPSACRASQTSMHRTVTDESILLVPACSGLDYAIAESAGRIVGTALNPGHFSDEGELSFVDRLNNLNTKVRLAWHPNDPVSRDLRLFALIAAPAEDQLPPADWTWGASCGADLCASLTVDGTEVVELGFTDDGTRYSLVSVRD